MKTMIKAKILLLIFLTAGASVAITHPDTGKVSSSKNNMEEKVLICHSPPGNSSAKQDLWVSASSVAAHLAHGDALGSCTEENTPCKECAVQYNLCLSAANGNPKALASCEENYQICMSQCGGGGPAPAPAPGGGK